MWSSAASPPVRHPPGQNRRDQSRPAHHLPCCSPLAQRTHRLMGGPPSNLRRRRRSHMAVREFTDNWGTEWRVWDVTPEVMHPITRSEDYMKKLQDGWLAFESASEKRRLPAPYPGEWTGYDLKRLEEVRRG